jgi:predicted site-specific integrase-resolvase
MNNEQIERIYTPQQLAEILSIDVKTLRKYSKEGKIKSIRISPRVIRYRQADLNTFLDEVGR